MENKWTEAATPPTREGEYLVFVSWYQGRSDSPTNDVRVMNYWDGFWRVSGWTKAEREELYVTHWMPIPETKELTIPEFLEYV